MGILTIHFKLADNFLGRTRRRNRLILNYHSTYSDVYSKFINIPITFTVFFSKLNPGAYMILSASKLEGGSLNSKGG